MIFRQKITLNTLGETTVSANIDGNTITKKVIVLPACDNQIIVKYIDNNGFYRFYPFSARYQEKVDVKKIGTITDRLGNEKNFGVSANRAIVASTAIEDKYLSVVKWLFVSPVVQIKLGDTWYDAEIADGSYVIRKGKGGIINIDIQFKLGELATIRR